MSTRHPMTRIHWWLVGVMVVGCLMVQPRDSWSKILRHVDANGVIWFTNIPPPAGARGSQVTPVASPPQRQLARLQGHPYRLEVEQLARQYRLNPSLVSALIAVESNFDPEAVSPKGAQGLMQLMPLIAQYYRVHNPFNPQDNIEGGIRYLADLLQLFGNQLPLALAAYNGGEGLVRRYGGVPPFLESYVDKVLRLSEHTQGTSIHRYILSSGVILFSDIPLTQEQRRPWDVRK